VEGEVTLFKSSQQIPRVAPQQQEGAHRSGNIARSCHFRSWLAKAACPAESEEVDLVPRSIQQVGVIGKTNASRSNADGSIIERFNESSKRILIYEKVTIDKGQIVAARYRRTKVTARGESEIHAITGMNDPRYTPETGYRISGAAVVNEHDFDVYIPRTEDRADALFEPRLIAVCEHYGAHPRMRKAA
jgi:hypothetical protein